MIMSHAPDCEITLRGPMGRNMPVLCTCGPLTEATPGRVDEPAGALVRAAVERLAPFVKDLRESGWAVDVVVHVEDSTTVDLRIDLSGLKQPIESVPAREQAAT